MKLTLEIDDTQFETWMIDNPTKTKTDFENELNNIIYLGGDCINAMAHRMMEIDINYYIEKQKPTNQVFLAKWANGENFTKWEKFEIRYLGDFTQDMGYSERHCLKLEILKVGEKIDLSDGISQYHEIERVQ